MKQPVSILYFSHFPHLQMGGQKSLLALIDRLNRTEYRPFALTSERGELSEALEQRNCPVFISRLPEAKRTYFWQPWRAESKNFFAAAAEIRRIALDCGAKILHCDEESDAVLCGAARRGTMLKTVYHVRLTNPSKLDRRIEPAIDRFIGVSEATRRRWSLKALQRYSIIADGLDCDLFAPPADKNQAKRKLDLPENKFIALFVGQIKASKGIFDMIDAFGLLSRDLPTEKMPLLLIAGSPLDGSILPEIEARTAENNCGDSVRIIGRRYDIELWMQAADVIALPSHEGTEGLPRVLFEGMACGAVALGTDVSGVREAIPHGTGLLVPEHSSEAIAEALKKLMNEPNYTEELRKAGIESARLRFDGRASARAVEKVYESLLEK